MTPRGWAAARVLGVLALAGGLVATSTQWPGVMQIGAAPAGTPPATMAPAPTPVSQALLGCPGAETEGISGLSAVPNEVVTVLAASAPEQAMQGISTAPGTASVAVRAYPSDAALASSSLRGGLISGQLTGIAVAEVSAAGALAAGVSAIQIGLRRDGDERGLQSLACQVPRSEVWLLAGGGAPTRRERLVVGNAGANAVSVDVQVFGAAGPIASVNGSRITVPPHGRIGLLVDALAPGEKAPAVRVTASGGLVTALLEDSWIDGATGRGRDDVGPSDGPATELVIPAVVLSGVGTLRIAVPGSDEAVVQSRLIAAAGASSLPADGVVRIAGGHVRDIDLSGVPAGAYAVQVRSDHPVVASVLIERRPAPTGPSDLAWLAAAPVVPVLAGTPVPAGTTAQIVLVGTATPWAASVFLVAADGQVSTQAASGDADTSWAGTVPAGTASVWIRPASGTVRAGLVAETSDDGGRLLTALSLEPIPLSSVSVPVREVRR